VNVIVALIGWIIVAIGLLGIAWPHLMPTAVLGWPPDFLLYFTVGILATARTPAAPLQSAPRELSLRLDWNFEEHSNPVVSCCS